MALRCRFLKKLVRKVTKFALLRTLTERPGKVFSRRRPVGRRLRPPTLCQRPHHRDAVSLKEAVIANAFLLVKSAGRLRTALSYR